MINSQQMLEDRKKYLLNWDDGIWEIYRWKDGGLQNEHAFLGFR